MASRTDQPMTEPRMTPERLAEIRRLIDRRRRSMGAAFEPAFDELRAELDAVTLERDEARKDSARLDWIETQVREAETAGLTIGGICYTSICIGRKRLAEGDDVREAIDVAMANVVL